MTPNGNKFLDDDCPTDIRKMSSRSCRRLQLCHLLVKLLAAPTQDDPSHSGVTDLLPHKRTNLCHRCRTESPAILLSTGFCSLEKECLRGACTGNFNLQLQYRVAFDGQDLDRIRILIARSPSRWQVCHISARFGAVQPAYSPSRQKYLELL
jgi:hypothetical protein